MELDQEYRLRKIEDMFKLVSTVFGVVFLLLIGVLLGVLLGWGIWA